TGEQSIVRESVELPFDPFALVEKPPTATELDFARNRPVLETPDQRSKSVVVRRIVVIDYHFGQRLFLVEAIQVADYRGGLWKIANAIKAGIGTQFAQQTGVVVAQCAQMELFGPSLLRVQTAKEHHHERAKLRPL